MITALVTISSNRSLKPFPTTPLRFSFSYVGAQPEKVLAELAGTRGKIIHTSLSPEQEKKLNEALGG
jgi:hypothetical protein